VGRTARRWFFALSLLGCLTSLAARAASPVWVLHGARSTVYLAGSIHLLPAHDAQLPPAFDQAYASAAKLVMELDLGTLDPLAVAGWMSEHGALPAGTRLRAVVGEPRYARLSAAATDLGITIELLDSQAPWAVSLELADLDYVHQGFDPESGVEEQLLRRAQSDHKPTAGLETLGDELGGLAGLARADQLQLLDQTLDDLKESPQETHDLVSAWRRGDAPKLAALLSQEYKSFPALYQQLVTARNQRWLPQIEQLVKGDQNCLIVVGALHLVGEGGLLELLRKDGFTSTQLN
jgi:uncharacterized protein YbaP (TraB family)